MDGKVAIRFHLNHLPLALGRYRIQASIYRWFENHPLLEVRDALSFEVQGAVIGNAIASYQRDFGIVRLAHGVTLAQGSNVRQFGR
jgi:hypothetical protein